MTVDEVFAGAGVTGTVCAAPVDADVVFEHRADEPVTPGSVMKVQVGLAALEAFDTGALDGRRRVVLRADRRTPGAVGIGAVNALTTRLRLSATTVTADLASMLDAMALEVGFADYAALADHEPGSGGPTADELRVALAGTSALDPSRGTRTTARDMVRLLQLVWVDEASSPQVCRRLRRHLGQQLTRDRIASGFGPEVGVAAKSGGLMGVVRSEVGVVTRAGGRAFAVAVFTRSDPRRPTSAAAVNRAIGRVAALAVDALG